MSISDWVTLNWRSLGLDPNAHQMQNLSYFKLSTLPIIVTVLHVLPTSKYDGYSCWWLYIILVRGWGYGDPVQIGGMSWSAIKITFVGCRIWVLIPGYSVYADHEIQLKTFPAIQNMSRHVKTLKRTPTVVFSKRSTFKAEGNGAQPVGRWQMPMLTDLGPEMCQLSILGVNKLLAIAIFGNITLMIQNSERSLAKATRKRSIYIYISNCIYIYTHIFDFFCNSPIHCT